MSWQNSWDKSEWGHYGRHSSWSGWDDWSQSRSPRTPPRKTKPEEVSSPQGGSGIYNLSVPDEFQQTRDFWDARESFGMKFAKKIQPTSWSMKHELAGREVTSIQLHEVCWQGWSNHCLRALSQGRCISVHFSRSIKEATFISYLLQRVRETKIDLDSIAKSFCQQHNLNPDSGDSEAQQKSFRMKQLCQFLIDLCAPFQQQQLSEAQDRIKVLEQELAQAKRASPSGSEPASGSKRPNREMEQSFTPEPAGKRMRLPVKTPASQASTPVDNRTLFQTAMDPKFLPNKVLDTNCPATASSQATTKWIQTLKVSADLKKELQQACKNACNTIKTMSEEDQEVLR